MKDVLDDLRSTLEIATGQLQNITETQSELRHSPDKWSRREILGHLIDSASNNHQRFVRAQIENNVTFPSYSQEPWVELQGYQGESWFALVSLWKNYNHHLLHVLSGIPEEKRANLCRVGESESVTLEFLARDYVRHLKHHLAQIFGA